MVGLNRDGRVLIASNDKPDSSNSIDEKVRSASEWTDIIAVASGGYSVAGLKADGTVITTGGTLDWTDIIAIDVNEYGSVLALKADGSLVTTDEERNEYLREKEEEKHWKLWD